MLYFLGFSSGVELSHIIHLHRVTQLIMASYNKNNETYEVTIKGGQESSSKRTVLIAAVIIVVLLVIVAISLGVTLSQDDHDSTSEKSISNSTEKPTETTTEKPTLPTTEKPKGTTISPVILISADGFRPDYLTLGLTPNIRKFGNNGVRAKFMLSQFPTKTFPNHYSAVTGLYPESHGIVFNTFYAPDLRRLFTIRYSSYPAFWHGEPIWVTANKSGLKSASYYWVGSEIKGKRPTYYRIYNQSVPFSDRVEQVLRWLQLPVEKRPSIITLYFHQPDYTGHGFGNDSPEVRQQIQLIDRTIGHLMKGLEDMNISDSVNMILLSDHGMSTVNCSDVIFLDKYGVLANELYVLNRGPVASFNAKNRSNLENIFNMIKCRNEPFQSFYKTDLPKRMHFSKSNRIDDVIVFADPGQLVSVNSTRRSRCNRGQHGFDTIDPDMWTIFLARGPSFQKGKVVEHFSNLEIYNLLASLLKIEPAPNNGTKGSLNSLLIPEARSEIPKSQGDGTVFRTDICKFPNDTVFDFRSKNGVCASCNISLKNVSEINMIFNITAEEASSFEEEHLPWGLPDGGVGVEGCLLSQSYFIIGYSTYLRIPLWTANRINGTQLSRNHKIEDCSRSDVRLTENQTALCTSYNNSGYDQGQLVPSEDLSFDKMAMLSTSTFSNIVPMYTVFEKGIWASLESMVRDWAKRYNVVHVITGTIFDVDEDGIKDEGISVKRRTHNLPTNPAIPTHFYKIVTRCESNMTSEYEIKKCSGTIRVISFILRHTKEHCKFHSYEKLILQNVAPVRDIELLTGINFFSKLPAQLQVELKSFIPVQLWS